MLECLYISAYTNVIKWGVKYGKSRMLTYGDTCHLNPDLWGMQVMPFWVKVIGNSDHDLFNLRTNLRYGCTILRHYLDMESGDMYRALGRYDGSLGKPEFPNRVHAAWKNHWGTSLP